MSCLPVPEARPKLTHPHRLVKRPPSAAYFPVPGTCARIRRRSLALEVR
jgi:hypothetical protein